MKNLLLVTIILGMPFFAKAHCPAEVVQNGKSYCASVEWLDGEKKIKGEFVGVDVETAYSIPMRERPQKWVYSRAAVSIWEKGDATHAPVFLEGFRVFHYMVMENGHHHDGGSYEFEKDTEGGVYLLSKMALHRMRGCWSLRWTFSHEDSMSESSELVKVDTYKNLSDAENEESMGFCMNSDGGDHSGHHNH